ncbi:MAG: universal stress protein [Bryobacteraceae bacterium]
MLAIKHILFPIDFSEQSQAAAPQVANLAKQFGAEVTLMSVIQPFWEPAGGILVPAGAPMLDLAELEQNLASRLQGALTVELAGITVHRNAQLGDPAHSITQFARSEGVDLIMLPTHGLGRFRTLLLGSVASKVLHDAECPVWTTAHTSEPGSHVEIKTVLCAVDGTPKGVPVMEWAAQFAARTKSKLRVIHAVPGVEGWPERQLDTEFSEFLKQKARETIDRQMQISNIQAPLCVVGGKIEAAIRDEAERHNADLVIIGRGLLDETLGRLRTHAYSIIRNTPCPVLSV